MNEGLMKRRDPLVTDLLLGAAAGIAGSAAMSITRWIMSRTGWEKAETPPFKVEHKLEETARIAHKTGEIEERAAAAGLHAGLGAIFGAVYTLLSRMSGLSPLVLGSIYGLGVYAFLIPGLGQIFKMTPPPWKESRRVVIRQLITHLLFGVVTSVTYDGARQALGEVDR